MNIDQLDWGKMDQCIPVIIQDVKTLQVLMLGYMNPEALEKTLATQQVTFYSRSKQRLWTKGGTSGNTLTLIELSMDCDNDALLIKAKPAGPICHKGTNGCFNLEKAIKPPSRAHVINSPGYSKKRLVTNEVTTPFFDTRSKSSTCTLDNEQSQSDWGFLCELEQRIKQRQNALPNNSYTAELFRSGIERMAQKVGEEGVEVALAAASNSPDKLSEESADLIFHLLVLLRAQNLNFSTVIEKLAQRME